MANLNNVKLTKAGKVTQASAVACAFRNKVKDNEGVQAFILEHFGIELTIVQARVAVYQHKARKEAAKGAKETGTLDPKELARRVKALKEEGRVLGFKVIKRKTSFLPVGK